MTSNQNGSKIKLNSASLDELLSDYSNAIERDKRHHEAVGICFALAFVAAMTIYLGYVHTLPYLGVIAVCLALFVIAVVIMRQAHASRSHLDGG